MFKAAPVKFLARMFETPLFLNIGLVPSMRVNKISFYGLEFTGSTTFLIAELSIENDWAFMC